MARRPWIALTILATTGLLITAVLTVVSGVQYRIRQDQGLDPVYAADWIVVGTYGGLGMFAVATVALAATEAVAFVRRRVRQHAAVE
jgi:hypothetical protein